MHLASTKRDKTRYRAISIRLGSHSTLGSRGFCTDGHGHNASKLLPISILSPPWMHLPDDTSLGEQKSIMASYLAPYYSLGRLSWIVFMFFYSFSTLLNPSSWLLVFPLRALDLHYRILPVLFHVMQICLHFSISSRLLFMLATFRRLSLHSHSPYKFYTCLRLLASSILLFTLPPVPPSHDSPTRHGCWV